MLTKFVLSAILDENKNLFLQALPAQNQGENNVTTIQVSVPKALAENAEFFLEFLCPKNRRYISPNLTAAEETENFRMYTCDIPSCVLQEEGFVQIQLVARDRTDSSVVYKSNRSNKTAFFVHPSVNASETVSVVDYFAKAEETLRDTRIFAQQMSDAKQEMEDFLQDVDGVLDIKVRESLAREEGDYTTGLIEETAARQAADLAEAQARENAIAAERSAREEAFLAEAEARSAEIEQQSTAFAQSVEAEATARAAAINAEKMARENADSNLMQLATAHTGATDNPHGVTKAQVGLANVANVEQYSAQNPNFGTDMPKANGTAGIGTATTYSRSDHVHPADSTSVRTTEQNFSDEEKLQARTNIGAGTSNFSGDYADLSNKPTIPTDVVRYDSDQQLTYSQKSRVRTNIGASSFTGNYADLRGKPHNPMNCRKYLLINGETIPLFEQTGYCLGVAKFTPLAETVELEFYFVASGNEERFYNLVLPLNTSCFTVRCTRMNNVLQVDIDVYNNLGTLTGGRHFVEYMRDDAAPPTFCIIGDTYPNGYISIMNICDGDYTVEEWGIDD